MLGEPTTASTDSPASTIVEAPSTPVSDKLKEVAEIEQVSTDVQTSESGETTTVETTQQTEIITESTTSVTATKEEQPVGPIFDINDKKVRKGFESVGLLEKGTHHSIQKLNFKDKTYLAPLTTVSHLNAACSSYGTLGADNTHSYHRSAICLSVESVKNSA